MQTGSVDVVGTIAVVVNVVATITVDATMGVVAMVVVVATIVDTTAGSPMHSHISGHAAATKSLVMRLLHKVAKAMPSSSSPTPENSAQASVSSGMQTGSVEVLGTITVVVNVVAAVTVGASVGVIAMVVVATATASVVISDVVEATADPPTHSTAEHITGHFSANTPPRNMWVHNAALPLLSSMSAIAEVHAAELSGMQIGAADSTVMLVKGGGCVDATVVMPAGLARAQAHGQSATNWGSILHSNTTSSAPSSLAVHSGSAPLRHASVSLNEVDVGCWTSVADVLRLGGGVVAGPAVGGQPEQRRGHVAMKSASTTHSKVTATAPK
jgi:hypothetical protein